MSEKILTARIFTNDFNRIIAATKSFAVTSSIRKCHTYIKLEFCAEDQRVTAIAVDGYRLAVEHSVIDRCENDFVAYVKPNIRLPKNQYATLSLEENEAVIRCGDFMFGYSQPEADKFLWREAIPADDPTLRLGFNGNYLLSALQAAKVSIGGSFKDPVVLEFRNNLTPVILRTNKDDIKMVLPIRIKD